MFFLISGYSHSIGESLEKGETVTKTNNDGRKLEKSQTKDKSTQRVSHTQKLSKPINPSNVGGKNLLVRWSCRR
jgi:hypothetical protein